MRSAWWKIFRCFVYFGIGSWARLCRRNFFRVIQAPSDFGPQLVIENFQDKNPSCVAEIRHTYFEDFETLEKFDVIVMGFVLERVDDPVPLIQRFSKFLSPTGVMYISVPNAAAMNRRLVNIMGVLKDVTDLSEHDAFLGHQRYYTVESLRGDVETAGLCIAKLEGIYLKPFTTDQMLSLNLSSDVIQVLCVLGVEYPELSCGLLAEVVNPERIFER
ncbi:MAG: class I SAM-dependent methyltransferase [Comamonas sp.]